MIECGEIYYIENDYRAFGRELHSGRPAIIISNDLINNRSGTVNIIYLTSSNKKRQHYVDINHMDFIPCEYSKKEYTIHKALCDQIHCVDKGRLGNYLGKVTIKELDEIKSEVLKTNFLV